MQRETEKYVQTIFFDIGEDFEISVFEKSVFKCQELTVYGFYFQEMHNYPLSESNHLRVSFSKSTI